MNVIIGNAWPYANGSLHLGRIAVLLPGDILARYHRLMGDDVVFVSGSDSHGTPVTMKAKELGLTPLESSEKYHDDFVRCFNKLNFSFDVFTKTHTEYHSDKVKEFILDLYKKGYIYEKEIEQYYCENCNESEVEDLLEKRCKVCNSETILRKTNHLFFKLSEFEKDVRRIFIRQHSWRENAIKITKRYLDEGLRDRAVTRDFNWGVDVPLEGYDDKKIYVWIEAVMGYLTASMKCIEDRGEEFKDYWDGDDSRIYLVHGKDNIPFHTILFPAILVGLGIKNPSIQEVSSEYLKLEGKSFSAAKNWAIWIDYIADNYNVDAIRYYLMLNSPEVKDSDFTWRDFINTTNNDLVGLYGNFINRVLVFTEKNFGGNIPNGEISKKLKDELFDLYFNVGDMIEEGKFKEGLQLILKMIRKANKFFDDEKPWTTIDSNKKKCSNTIYTCIQLIINFSNLLEPFMPSSSQEIRRFFDVEEGNWSYTEVNKGRINNVSVLFEKIDKKNINDEVKRMKEERI